MANLLPIPIRDEMIQHLKILMHCHKNITIHQYIEIMSHDWQNVLLKVILTLVVNWHLCLVSHNQITFIPFCECISHHKNAVWPHKTNQNLCCTQLCIPIILNTKCIDIATEVYIDTCIDLSCIVIHQCIIIPSLIPMLKNVVNIAEFQLLTDNQCNPSIYHKFHHVIPSWHHTHAYILVSEWWHSVLLLRGFPVASAAKNLLYCTKHTLAHKF